MTACRRGWERSRHRRPRCSSSGCGYWAWDTSCSSTAARSVAKPSPVRRHSLFSRDNTSSGRSRRICAARAWVSTSECYLGGGRLPDPGSLLPLPVRDRKSTRLNSSHLVISYAVFCLKKKKKNTQPTMHDEHQTQNKEITSD